MAESFGRVRKPLQSDMLAAQRRKDAAKADKAKKPSLNQPRPNPDLLLGRMDVGRKGGPKPGEARSGGHFMIPGRPGQQNATSGIPGATATPAKTGPSTTPSKSKPAAPAKSSKPKSNGSAGAASNRDLPGKTTITYAQGPKRDVAALQTRSKASLADSKAAAASRSNGPGGGAERALASYRGQKPKREMGR